MNSSSLPEVIPVDEPVYDVHEIEEATDQSEADRDIPEPQTGSWFLRLLRGVIGWTMRLILGAALCMFYATSIVVFGWTYRWMRSCVLKSWWKQSRFRREGTFRSFSDKLGADAPVARPRLIVRDRVLATVKAHPGKTLGGQVQYGLRVLSVPVHSLWLNFKTGVQGLFCTYLFTGWGCLLMLFGWRFGWLNSFFKGYEYSAVGPLTSLLGIVLFIAAMYYVVMAQVHQAVTGQRKAFFDFAFVWKLIQARATAYCGLVIVMAILALPIELMKLFVLGGQFFSNNDNLTHGQVLGYSLVYVFFGSLLVFSMLLLVRRLAAKIYSSALLKCLRTGTITREELPKPLCEWLDRLEIQPTPLAANPGLANVAMKSFWWTYRNLVLYVIMFVVFFGMIARKYVGEFLVRHPYVGFTNHELVQFPTFDIIPAELWKLGTQKANEKPLT